MAEFKEKDNTGSLWLTRYKETGEVKKTKDGEEYFSGNCLIGGKKYFVNLFDNRHKKKHEKSPDFSLMFNEPQWQSKGVNPVSRAKEEWAQSSVTVKNGEIPF